MSRILLVDDDVSLLKLMSMRLRSQGYEVDTADSAEGALDRLRQQRADLVLSDLRMAGMDGLALFERIQSQWLGLPVIIMTAHGTIPDAIQATRSGVFSFLTKPIDKDELFATIEHALSLTRPKQQQEWQSLILTRNPQMEQLLIQANSIAGMEVPVLIMGPSGSGKGVMTQALHQASSRRDKPLHVINCAALPWPALDLQLFGEDGQSGLFEQAKGATLFLDEIGDLSESLQAKLLQVLQEYGQGTPEVRVISSSHQDLVTAMEEGRFREDLFYTSMWPTSPCHLSAPAVKTFRCWPDRRWTNIAVVTVTVRPWVFHPSRWPCWRPQPGPVTCVSSTAWWNSWRASVAVL